MKGNDGANLLEQFGKSLSVADVAQFLNLSPASVRKYASSLGGVEVIPGKLRFFERVLEERLNAQSGKQERCAKVARQCDGQGRQTTEVVPRRQSGVKTPSNGLGTGGKTASSPSGDTATGDPFNLLGPRMGDEVSPERPVPV